MKYKILPHARVVIATDGSKQLFIDTGKDVVPISASTPIGPTPSDPVTPAPLPEDVIKFMQQAGEIIEVGGVGRIEHRVDVLMDDVVPLCEATDWEECAAYADPAHYDLSYRFSANKYCTMYVNGVEYSVQIIKGSIMCYRADGASPEFGCLDGYDNKLVWLGNGPAPETIAVRIEYPYNVTHKISNEFLADELTGLPKRMSFLESGGVIVEKAEYTALEYSDESSMFYLTPAAVPSSNTSLVVHIDGVDYTCMTRAEDGMVGFGNLAMLGPYPDTGEPFAGGYVPQYGMLIMALTTGGETHTIGIKMAGAAGGGGTSESTIVDLDAYGIGSTVLGLVGQGGGSTTVVNNPAFWTEVSMNSNNDDVRMHLTYNSFDVLIAGATRFFSNTACINICFGFMVASEMGEVTDVKVSIAYIDDSQTRITVKVV